MKSANGNDSMSYQEKHIVYLDGKITGEIREEYGSYRYYPKGSKTGGKVFATLNQCKQSLEAE